VGEALSTTKIHREIGSRKSEGAGLARRFSPGRSGAFGQLLSALGGDESEFARFGASPDPAGSVEPDPSASRARCFRARRVTLPQPKDCFR